MYTYSAEVETIETLRQFLERRWAVLSEERQTWEQHWQELSEFILPRTSRFLSKGAIRSGYDVQGTRSGSRGASSNSIDDNWGGKKNDKIINGEATFAINTLTSGLMSGVTSPSRRWFKLLPADEELEEDTEVRTFLHETETKMFNIFERSNLYQMLPNNYEELTVYGTGAMGMFRDDDTLVRFENFTCGEYWINHDYKYKVDAFFRIVLKDIEQLVSEYAMRDGQIDDNMFMRLSQEAQMAWRQNNFGTKFEVMECIVPRMRRDFLCGSKLEWGDFPFVQVVYERGTADQRSNDKHPKYLHMGGFDHMPIMVSRWHLLTPDVYGRSPGMQMLGDVKQLQAMEKVKGIALQKHINPPMLATPSLKDKRLSTLAGDVTFLEEVGGSPGTGGNQGFRPAYQVDPRLDYFTNDIEHIESRIRKHAHADLFLAINNIDRSNVTATEVQAREREQLLLLGPAMLRLDEDLLKPLINHTFDYMVEKNLIPPPPPQLQGQNLKIEYLSIIAAAQKAQELIGLEDTARYVYQISTNQIQAGERITAADKFNAERSVDIYARIRSVDPSVVRTTEELEAIRQRKAQEMQQMQQQQQMQMMPQQLKDISQIQTGPQPGDNLVVDGIKAASGQPTGATTGM